MGRCCHCFWLSAGSLAGFVPALCSLYGLWKHFRHGLWQSWLSWGHGFAFLPLVCLGDLSDVWGQRWCSAVSGHLCSCLSSTCPLTWCVNTLPLTHHLLQDVLGNILLKYFFFFFFFFIEKCHFYRTERSFLMKFGFKMLPWLYLYLPWNILL